MNKMNKKGFTIVELVIVIAVIAILAGVLIPTFGGIIDRANESAELQELTAAYKNAYAAAIVGDGKVTTDDFKTASAITGKTETCLKVEGYDYEFYYADATGWSVIKIKDNADAKEYSYKYNADGSWTVGKYTAPANPS